MFKHLKISAKMSLSFGGVALIALFLGLLGYRGGINSIAAVHEIGVIRLPSVENLLIVKAKANELIASSRSLLIPDLDKKERQRQYDIIARAREQYQTAWDIYEPLPQTDEEAALWRKFVPAWQQWREADSVFLELAKKFEAMDLGDPMELARNLETFRGDHYKLASDVLVMLNRGSRFEGGEDHQSCNFGKWMASFATTNPELLALLRQVRESHHNFHEGVKKIKELTAAGNVEEAKHLYTTQLVANMELTFKTFDAMLALANSAHDVLHEADQQLLVAAYGRQVEANELLDRIIKINSDVAAQAVNIAKQQASRQKTVSLSASILGVAAALLIALAITRGIAHPIRECVRFTNRLAQGDFSTSVPEAFRNRGDEIGDLSRAYHAMVGNVSAMLQNTIESAQTLTASSTALAAVSRQLSANAKDTSDKSATVAAAAEEMSVNIQSVSAAMEQSTSNVNMVASATEEMTATVNEIAQSAEKARSISEGAVKQSQKTSEKMTALGDSARKIGRVTETITDISEQTNLLALNATIEAARAGEAGKGFAVVANEIKELAKQTASATMDIKQQIAGVQGTAGDTIKEIKEITSVIDNVNAIVSNIASAVIEQAAATEEIAKNIEQASQGLQEVNENVSQSSVVANAIAQDIAQVNAAATDISSSSERTRGSADGMLNLARELNKLVGVFKI